MSDHRVKEKLVDIANRLNDDTFRLHCLSNEQNTKNWIIVPTLMALGWDVHSPDVYSEDSGGVSGKVDYGLRIDGKVRVFIEAKALGKTLDDKDAEQTSNYANNKGVTWCVLTNGRYWKIYKSSGAALSDRLLVEAELAADTVEFFWEHLRYLARPQVAEGRLDEYANRIFIDSRIQDILDNLLCEPTTAFLNVLQKSAGAFSHREIRDSLQRLSLDKKVAAPLPTSASDSAPKASNTQVSGASQKSEATKKQSPTKPTRNGFTLQQHFEGKPSQIKELFETAVQRTKDIVTPQQLEVVPKKQTLGLCFKKSTGGKLHYVADIEVQRNKLKINISLPLSMQQALPPMARDVGRVGHWGNGNTQFAVESTDDLELAMPFIQQAFHNIS